LDEKDVDYDIREFRGRSRTKRAGGVVGGSTKFSRKIQVTAIKTHPPQSSNFRIGGKSSMAPKKK